MDKNLPAAAYVENIGYEDAPVFCVESFTDGVQKIVIRYGTKNECTRMYSGVAKLFYK